MTIAQKNPDNFEDLIYQALLNTKAGDSVLDIAQITEDVSKVAQTKVLPETVFGFVKRMCEEGMIERVDDTKYRAIKFDSFSFPVI